MLKRLIVSILCFALTPVALLHASPDTSFSHTPVAGPGGSEEHNGVIKGKVVTADGQPAAAVTVVIKGTKKTTLTNEDGTFAFYNLPDGDYDIEVTLAGYSPIVEHVSVSQHKTADIDIKLQVSNKQLEQVVVTAGVNKYHRNISDGANKMPLKDLENSQVAISIPKEVLADQMVYTVDDAMRNATGIQTMWAATGRVGDGGAYYNSRGFYLQSQLRNGIAGNVTSKIDAANLESIEVLKGPSATLFGSTLTSYGGLINRVTKKPYDGFGGEVQFAGGNYDFSRISADVNTPLDSAHKILLRVNTAYTDQGSYFTNTYSRLFAFDPSISIKVNDKLSFLFDAEIYRGKGVADPLFSLDYNISSVKQFGANRADKLPIDYHRSFLTGDFGEVSNNTNLFGQMHYQFNSQWSTQTNVTLTNSYSDGPGPWFSVLANANVTGNPNDIGADYIAREDQNTSASRDRMFEVQQNINGDFRIGSFRNRFVAGLDYFNHTANQMWNGAYFDTVMDHGAIANYDKFTPSALQSYYITHGPDYTYPTYYKTNTYSAYVSDVFNLRDNLLLMAALRVDHFVNQGNYYPELDTTEGAYNQTHLAPKFGIVWQPVRDAVALFANYQSGFTNETGHDYQGRAFKPEQAYQFEGGVKVDAFKHHLSATVSVYDIQVKDVIHTFTPAAGDTTAYAPGAQIQNGTKRSRGIEAEVTANPIPGLNILAGFSYNDTKLTNSDADVDGLRPTDAMSPYSANWWISYHVPSGALKGFGAGFGGNYASDNRIVNSHSEGYFILPAYTVFNAAINYEYSKFRFSIKADNLTNKRYFIGYSSIEPQRLRSVVASVAFKF